MQKPDGTEKGTIHYHYALHAAHEWLCEHTCSMEPSTHRTSRPHIPHASHEQHHANAAELHSRPNHKRSLRIAEQLLAELHAVGHLLPAHVYAAIYHQAKTAHDALAPPPTQPFEPPTSAIKR